MRRALALLVAALALSILAFAKDYSSDYQIGTFIAATAPSPAHSTAMVRPLRVMSTPITLASTKSKVADGTWYVTTLAEAQDSRLRNLGMIPAHLKSEKVNPLDGLKDGDKVLFRLHERHYLNGKFTLMAIPYADNPNKEVDFTTRFVPDVSPQKPEKPTDNVKAMCDAHKPSPELEKQFCEPSTLAVPVAQAHQSPTT